jgi:hypothetical protein
MFGPPFSRPSIGKSVVQGFRKYFAAVVKLKSGLKESTNMANSVISSQSSRLAQNEGTITKISVKVLLYIAQACVVHMFELK